MSSLLDAANVSSTRAINKIEVTDKLPNFVDDVSIMTYKQLWDALKFTKGNANDDDKITAPLWEFGENIYHAYAVNNIKPDISNKQVLIDLGIDWYKHHYIPVEKHKPIIEDKDGHQIIGGPLIDVTYGFERAGADSGIVSGFSYICKTERGIRQESTFEYDIAYIESIGRGFEDDDYSGERYVAVVKVEDDSWLQSGFPVRCDPRPSLLTLRELGYIQQGSIKVYGKVQTLDIFSFYSIYRPNIERYKAEDLFKELKQFKNLKYRELDNHFIGGQLYEIDFKESALKHSDAWFNFKFIDEDLLEQCGWDHNVPADTYVVLQGRA